MVTREFRPGRPVLATGDAWFTGGWLAPWLGDQGARASGYAPAPDTTPSSFTRSGRAGRLTSYLGDVHDAGLLAEAVAAARPPTRWRRRAPRPRRRR